MTACAFLSYESAAASLLVVGCVPTKGLGYCDIVITSLNIKSDRCDEVDFLFDLFVVLVDHVAVLVDALEIAK